MERQREGGERGAGRARGVGGVGGRQLDNGADSETDRQTDGKLRLSISGKRPSETPKLYLL